MRRRALQGGIAFPEGAAEREDFEGRQGRPDGRLTPGEPGAGDLPRDGLRPRDSPKAAVLRDGTPPLEIRQPLWRLRKRIHENIVKTMV